MAEKLLWGVQYSKDGGWFWVRATNRNDIFSGTKEESEARRLTTAFPDQCRIMPIQGRDVNIQTAEAARQHPGFEITCRKCSKQMAVFESDVGFSCQSGAWGSVRLLCLYCGKSDRIWAPE